MLNKQTRKSKIDTYKLIAPLYGTLTENSSSIVFYNYSKYEKQIDELIDTFGYQFYFAGGRYPIPDFKIKNYGTKWLMIYDPSPSEGGSFHTEEETRAWRKIHELAHALTVDEINLKYGEGKRNGSYINGDLSKNDVLRAVEWEYLANYKQRALSEQIGIYLSEVEFAHELNVNISDAVHRAIFGLFIEPELEGFVPFNYSIKLDESLDILHKLFDQYKDH